MILYDFYFTRKGTLHSDMQTLVMKFLTGVNYTAKSYDVCKTYGTTEVTFGTVCLSYKNMMLKILTNFIENMMLKILTNFVVSLDSLLSICFHSSSTWIQKSWRKISLLLLMIFIAQNHDGQNLSLESNIQNHLYKNYS